MSEPLTHTPKRTSPGAPGGTSALGIPGCRTTGLFNRTRSTPAVPLQDSAKP